MTFHSHTPPTRHTSHRRFYAHILAQLAPSRRSVHPPYFSSRQLFIDICASPWLTSFLTGLFFSPTLRRHLPCAACILSTPERHNFQLCLNPTGAGRQAPFFPADAVNLSMASSPGCKKVRFTLPKHRRSQFDSASFRRRQRPEKKLRVLVFLPIALPIQTEQGLQMHGTCAGAELGAELLSSSRFAFGASIRLTE